jgi:transcriptional regulator with XRE-family HTH domain
MRGTTIARVAEEAGVGVGTVSRVLNGSPAVSADTRKRVLEAIATLDYQPSPAARALSTGRTNAIGVVAPFFTQSSVIERLRGVSHTLANDGYQLILHDVERADQRRELFRSLAGRGNIDVLLAISLAPTEREARRMLRAGVAVVLVDRDHPTLPCITIDDTEGGRMATEFLLELGHREIAFLGDEEANLFGFDSSAATAVSIMAGLGVLVLTATTASSTGLTKVIPLALHPLLDLALVAVLIASPFVFGYSDEAAPTAFFMVFGVWHLLLTIATRFGPRAETTP